MKPTRTIVRLARAGGEWNRLYALAKRAGERPHKGDFAFPTVVAERDGEVVGFLATWPRDDAIVAGPLVLEGGRNPFLFIRLVEGYENLLKLAKVKTYLHTIDKNRPEHVSFMERLNFVKCGETATHFIMRRELT